MRIGEICQALKYLQNSVTKRLEIRIVKNKRAWDKKKKKNFRTREGMEVQTLYFAWNKNGFLFKTVSFFKMLILNYEFFP